MKNHFQSPNKEMIQKNKSIRTNTCYNQMLNRNQSLGHLMPPQGMQQRYQNYPRPINFTQGSSQVNNVEDVKTQSFIPHASNNNNNINASIIASGRYDQMLHLARRPSASLGQTSDRNIDPLSFIKKNSFNGVNLQGHTSGFPNPSPRTTFHNEKKLSSHPCGTNFLYPSHQKNNSLVLNDLNLHPGVNMNKFNGVMDIATPSLLPPIQNQNLDLFPYTRERASKRLLCESQETDVMASSSKRPKLSFIPPNYYEGLQSRMKGLPVFKDEKLPISTSNIKADAKKNVHKGNLDLSLHL